MDLLSKDKLDKEEEDSQQGTLASSRAGMVHATSPPLKTGQGLVKLPRHTSNTYSSALGLEVSATTPSDLFLKKGLSHNYPVDSILYIFLKNALGRQNVSVTQAGLENLDSRILMP